MIVQNAGVRPFDINQVEGDIREAVHHRPPHPVVPPPRTRTPPVPEYVSHRDDVTEIGKLSAEAIIREYEVTAKEIEALGEVVKDMMLRCDQLTTSASSMLKDIKTTALSYRKEGKRIFNEIESCSSATDEVRRLCEAFQDKIAIKIGEHVT